MSTEGKESSPDLDSAVFPSLSSGSSGLEPRSSNEVSRSSSGDIATNMSAAGSDPLHLQVPSVLNSLTNSYSTGSTSSSQQSSPRPSTTTLPDSIVKPCRTRGFSSSSSLSTGPISYRDLSDIQDEFKIVKILHDGQFSKVLLTKQETGGVEENSSDSETSTSVGAKLRSGSPNKYLVLKAVPSGGLISEDFMRELRYNYYLSPHPNIVTSFNISFNWASTFNVFVQEYAPYGDLSRHMGQKPLPESQVKLIANQLASALEFMHSFKLVHQDICPENVLIFKANMSRVKLCDFGLTHKEGSLLAKGHLTSSLSSLCPQLSYLLPQERYEVHRSSDVWQVGILIIRCLTGKYPWTVAEFSDPTFRQYTSWLKRKSLKVPEPFKRFTPRLIRLLKRLLEPKQHFRSEIREVFKYLADDWVKPNCSRMSFSSSSSASGSNKNNSRNQSISLEKLHNNSTSNKKNNSSSKSKLIILTSNGINLLAKRESNGKKPRDVVNDSGSNKDASSIESGQEEMDSVSKRVENWVETTAQVPAPILFKEQGRSESLDIENEQDNSKHDDHDTDNAQKPETGYDNE